MSCGIKEYGSGKYKYRLTKLNKSTLRWVTKVQINANSMRGAELIAGRNVKGIYKLERW